MDWFDRVPPAYRAAIGEARAWVPRVVAELPVRFLCGVDHKFVGHRGEGDEEPCIMDGVNYSEASIASALLWPLDKGAPTILIPRDPVGPESIVHELGHILELAYPHLHDLTPETSCYSTAWWGERVSEALMLMYESEVNAWGDWQATLAGEDFKPLRDFLVKDC